MTTPVYPNSQQGMAPRAPQKKIDLPNLKKVRYEKDLADLLGKSQQVPTAILISMLKCVHCPVVKAQFIQFARKNPNLYCIFIIIDEFDNKQELIQQVGNAFPVFLLAYKQRIATVPGDIVKMQRTFIELIQSASSSTAASSVPSPETGNIVDDIPDYNSEDAARMAAVQQVRRPTQPPSGLPLSMLQGGAGKQTNPLLVGNMVCDGDQCTLQPNRKMTMPVESSQQINFPSQQIPGKFQPAQPFPPIVTPSSSSAPFILPQNENESKKEKHTDEKKKKKKKKRKSGKRNDDSDSSSSSSSSSDEDSDNSEKLNDRIEHKKKGKKTNKRGDDDSSSESDSSSGDSDSSDLSAILMKMEKNRLGKKGGVKNSTNKANSITPTNLAQGENGNQIALNPAANNNPMMMIMGQIPTPPEFQPQVYQLQQMYRTINMLRMQPQTPQSQMQIMQLMNTFQGLQQKLMNDMSTGQRNQMIQNLQQQQIDQQRQREMQEKQIQMQQIMAVRMLGKPIHGMMGAFNNQGGFHPQMGQGGQQHQ
jgi:hypothetical protein